METKKRVIGLCDFLEAIGRAGTVARHQCAEANIAQMADYLEPTDDPEVFRFKTLGVVIGDEVQHVPIYGLVPCGHLDLKKLDIEFETVVDMNVHHPVDTTGNPKIGLGMSRRLFGHGTELKVTASFNLAKPCETSEQIRDKLNKALVITTKEIEHG